MTRFVTSFRWIAFMLVLDIPLGLMVFKMLHIGRKIERL